MLRLAVLTVLLSTPLASAQVTVCTTEWTNAAGGDWNDAANWSGAAVPGPADDACVTLDGTYTVTNTTAPQIDVGSLTLGAASGTQTLESDEGIAVSADSAIEANGVLRWRIGALTGGATLTNRGQIDIFGFFSGVQRTIEGAGTVLLNEGTIDWTRRRPRPRGRRRVHERRHPHQECRWRHGVSADLRRRGYYWLARLHQHGHRRRRRRRRLDADRRALSHRRRDARCRRERLPRLRGG